MKIKRIVRKDPYYERIAFKAIGVNGKEIFGAHTSICRDKSIRDNKWGEWEINWGTTGSGTYEEKEPYYAVIRRGMKELKRKSKN